MINENLIEPTKYYEKFLKKEFDNKVNELFSNLTKDSNVDVKQNVETVRKYNQEYSKLNEYKSKKNLFKFFLIFSIIVVVLGLILGYYSYIEEISSKFLYLTALSPLFIGLGVLSYLKIKNFKKLIKEKDTQVNDLKKKAYEQVLPLISIINNEDFLKLIEQIIPGFVFFPYIPGSFITLLNSRSEYENEILNHIKLIRSEDIYCTSVISGSIEGKLFLFFSYIQNRMGEKTYTGSLTLPYTYSVTDSEGRLRRETSYETIYASVIKPYPYYFTYHRGMYFSNACPRLSFFREPIHIREKSEKQYQRLIKKRHKDFIKAEKKGLTNSSNNFTAMHDKEFEVAFNTKDRDNEVEFRMMYTPLAIREFLTLIKSKEGFGDNFYIEKDGCVTSTIFSKSQFDNLNEFRPDLSYAKSFSYNEIKNIYLNAGKRFFKDLYFGLSPLFMVPIYAQSDSVKPEEVFNKEKKSESYDGFDAESIASSNPESFRPSGTSTDVIINAIECRYNSLGSTFKLNAHSYVAVNRVEYVYTRGFNVSGNVPVHWVEFIPKSRESFLFIKYFGIPHFFAKKVIESVCQGRTCFYKDGFFAVMVKSYDTMNEESFINMIKNLSANVNMKSRNTFQVLSDENNTNKEKTVLDSLLNLSKYKE